MIDLSIDLSYLSRYFGVSTISNFYAPSTGSIEESETTGEEELTIVTEDGAITVNADVMQKLLQEPEKLATILKLQDPNNRYLIIQQFNEDDLCSLLPYLDSEQLSFGLQYFTTDGLNELMINLPQEQMINLLLEHFTMEDVAMYMQVNEMDEFFKSTELDKNDVLEYFESMEYEQFQKLMVNQFGAEFEEKSAEEYLEYIENMDDLEYQQFLLNMEKPEKMAAMAGLCEINPDYYELVDNEVLTRPIMNTMNKGDIIKTMSTLDPEFLVPMIEELPQDLIQVVATQIDPSDFADMLSSEFPDMIMDMLVG
ncbi:MAG: hypothetical protein LUE64_05310 [Candidatus Gastranaerophilales bacterium]|nr:hypothetical protein [Candidatus Gastranaerophilales bacterium]